MNYSNWKLGQNLCEPYQGEEVRNANLSNSINIFLKVQNHGDFKINKLN